MARLTRERNEAQARVAEIERENWVIYENTKGRIEQAEQQRDEALEQLRLTLISDTMNEGEANDLRDALDAACAVLKLPDSTNDGGPADLAAELRTLLHNHRVEVEDVERERDTLRSLLREVREFLPAEPDDLDTNSLAGRIDAALEGRDG